MTDIRDLVQALADTSARVWLLDPELGEQWDGTAALITDTINAARRDGYESGMREGVRVTPRLTLDRTFLDREKARLLGTANRYWQTGVPVTAQHVIDDWFATFTANLRQELASGRYGRAADEDTGFEAADRLLERLLYPEKLAGMLSIQSVMLSLGVTEDDR